MTDVVAGVHAPIPAQLSARPRQAAALLAGATAARRSTGAFGAMAASAGTSTPSASTWVTPG